MRIPPVRVEAIDTTGAGDAFIGSFARYFAAGLGLEAALGRATRYAADSVTKRGAQKSFATEAEFEALCARGGAAAMRPRAIDGAGQREGRPY